MHDLIETLNGDSAHWDCAEKVKQVLDRDKGRIGGRRIAWTSESRA